MTTPPNEPDVLLILRPAKDPLAEVHHQPPRDSDYRLKLALKTLLRAYGLKCIACRDVRDGAKPMVEKFDSASAELEGGHDG